MWGGNIKHIFRQHVRLEHLVHLGKTCLQDARSLSTVVGTDARGQVRDVHMGLPKGRECVGALAWGGSHSLRNFRNIHACSVSCKASDAESKEESSPTFEKLRTSTSAPLIKLANQEVRVK